MRLSSLLSSVILGANALGLAAWAHGDHDHGEHVPAAKPEVEETVTPLPWSYGGPFVLRDQNGEIRNEVDPDGHHQLLFFGYATCPGICSAALPMMAKTVRALAEDGINVTPMMVTIDPEIDTPEKMGPALAEISPAFVGLTGDEQQLSLAYVRFHVMFEKLFDDPDYGPIYSHGSHIFLLDPSGEVLTLLPPVLQPEQAVEIITRYVNATAEASSSDQ